LKDPVAPADAARSDRGRRRLVIATAVSGVLLPLLTWAYARAIDERIVFEAFPDPILLAFNGVAFAALAFAIRYLPVAAGAGALLGLLAISIQLHMGYWQSHSSTTALLFLFYLPWAFVAAGLGCLFGYIAGRLGKTATAVLLLTCAVLNIHWSNYGRFNLPAKLGVVASDEVRLTVEKSSFFTPEQRIGALTSIERRACSSDSEATLTFTGRGGAAFVTESGELRGFVEYEEVAGFDVFPVDVDGDGICEFADHAGGWSPVGLIDSAGRYVFRYGKSMSAGRDEKLIEIDHSPQGFIPFDVGADGRVEFLVPLLIVGRQETHILDASGEKIRTMSEDVQGSRSLEGELYTPTRGELVVRNADLRIARKLPLGFENGWSFVRWPEPDGAWHLAIVGDDGLRVLGLEDGAEKATIPQVDRGTIAFLDGRVVVVFAENRRQFLGVLDSGGRKLYEEVLEPGGELLATGGNSFLLSECSRDRCPTVWRYRLP
jgi:hypothetical protein